jgi:capsular exopolysaccharide synthesis family protein
MSQDFQLALNRGPSNQIEPWAMGGNASTALGPVGPQVNPLQKIHRSMRGRYLLAIILALLGAGAGGAAGYLTGEPGYVSTGAIRVVPTVPQIDKVDTVMQMYDRFMTSQAMILMSDRLVKFAIEHPDWKAVNNQPVPNPVAAFEQGLKAEFIKNSEIIQVTYTHKDPVMAQAAVKAVIKSYDEHFAKQQSSDLEIKLKKWQETRYDATTKSTVAQHTIEELGKKWGTQELGILANAAWGEVTRLQQEIIKANLELQAVESPTGPTVEDMSVEDIAQVDPTMANNLRMKDEIEAKMSQNKLGGMGPNSQAQKLAKDMLDFRNAQIAERAKWFREKWKGYRFTGQGMMARGTPQSVEEMKAAIQRLDATRKEQEAQAQQYSDVKQQIEQARQTIATQKEREKEASDWIDKLTFQLENLGKVQVLAEGDLPDKALDNRTKLALVGCVGGGAIPIGLLLLIGLLDTRYRYSDEATSTDMQGVTLLGILPNLPDRLSDPEQAAIAAHCVHQIRTMLQINGGGMIDASGERRVFAVTSASPGDGKTSLTLALGLSYAACGTRTLLIDCDLVGAGLSTRMNVHASEGVLEAIATRSLLPYIRTTDIADVAILPVGSAHGYHASTLSPTALRRLIDEAKKHFDTILIDTGPILGSIEASLVCAAADGVVLAVSRGQSRPLVEKSLNHLNGIGARLAGVVFNRAQTNDFERSISGMSMRSVATIGGRSGGNGRPSASGDAVGPIARSVAPYARKTDSEGGDSGNGDDVG